MERYKGYYNDLQEAFNDQMANVKKIITMDIRRTYANVITQDTKDKMFRILYTYAKRNMEMGYCQGINFIVYYLLEMKFSEERAFWILAYLVEHLIPKGYYGNMVPVISDIKLFKHILRLKQPKLIKHFQKISLDLNFFVISWFVTIFTNVKNLYVN